MVDIAFIAVMADESLVGPESAFALAAQFAAGIAQKVREPSIEVGHQAAPTRAAA